MGKKKTEQPPLSPFFKGELQPPVPPAIRLRRSGRAGTSAPRAIGPYSQAIRAGEFIFVSGQIPIDPMTGLMISGGMKEQTRRVIENLKAALESVGAGLNDVVKTTVYLTDMSAFGEMNEVYGEFFTPPYPARATVGVMSLPKGASIEIEAVAVVKK